MPLTWPAGDDSPVAVKPLAQGGGILLSIVIPVLNEAERLPALLADLAAAAAELPHEVLVVDGGSRDGSTTLASLGGARVLHAAPGRGSQILHGIGRCEGEWLLLLHADVRLPQGWWRSLRQAMAAMARRIGLSGSSDAALARAFLDAVRTLAREVGIPTTLDALRPSDIPTLAEEALAESYANYPVPRWMGRADCEQLITRLLPSA